MLECGALVGTYISHYTNLLSRHLGLLTLLSCDVPTPLPSPPPLPFPPLLSHLLPSPLLVQLRGNMQHILKDYNDVCIERDEVSRAAPLVYM